MNQNNPNPNPPGGASAPVSTAPVPFVDLALVAGLGRDLAQAKAVVQSVAEILEKSGHTPTPDKCLMICEGRLLDLSAAILPEQRIEQNHNTAGSFCRALKRWGRNDMTALFFDAKAGRVTAFLDYHEDRTEGNKEVRKDARVHLEKEPEAAPLNESLDYRERRVAPKEKITLVLQPSEEFQAWVGKNGVEIDQAGFAEFVEQHIEDIEGDGSLYASGSQLLKVAIELEARKEVQWAAKVNPQTGDRTMVWKEATTGAEGGCIVPKRVALRLRAYQGALPMTYVAALSFRASPQGVKFRLQFIGLDRCQESARAAINVQIEQESGYPVFDASCEAI